MSERQNGFRGLADRMLELKQQVWKSIDSGTSDPRPVLLSARLENAAGALEVNVRRKANVRVQALSDLAAALTMVRDGGDANIANEVLVSVEAAIGEGWLVVSTHSK